MASSLVAIITLTSVPNVMLFWTNNIAARILNPHWGINPTNAPKIGPSLCSPKKSLSSCVFFLSKTSNIQ